MNCIIIVIITSSLIPSWFMANFIRIVTVLQLVHVLQIVIHNLQPVLNLKHAEGRLHERPHDKHDETDL